MLFAQAQAFSPDVACMSPGGRNCSSHFWSLLCVIKAPYDDFALGRLANVLRLSFDRIREQS